METIKGAVLNANGIFGLGICLDSACKEDMAATNSANNQLKLAQAQALQNLSSAPTSGSNTTIVIVVIIAIVLVLGFGGWFLLKKKVI